MSGAATELETLIIRLMGDAKDFIAMTKAAEKKVAEFALRMEAKATEIEEKFTSVGKKMSMAITAPLAAMGAISVKSFADFDLAMTNSTAILDDAVGETQQKMRDLAFELSGKTATSARDLAAAYEFLASAGYNANQAMAAIPITQQFATAGAFDMAKATDLLVDALNAFKMPAEDMKKLADAMVLGNVQANASVQQLSESITNDAGSAMNNFGQDLETTIAILAAYAAQGKKGAEAGNLLGRAARLLTQAYRENGEVFEQFGIRVVDKATGQYRNMIDIIADLERGFEGLTKPQRDAALEQLGFAALAQKSITPLIGLSDQMKVWLREQKSATGYMDQVASKKLAAFSNQMTIVKNNMQNAATEIGENLAPMLTMLGNAILVSLEYWRELDDGTKSFLAVVAIAAASLGPLALAIGLTAKAYVVLSGAILTTKAMLIAKTAAVWSAVTAMYAYVASFSPFKFAAAVFAAVRTAVIATWAATVLATKAMWAYVASTYAAGGVKALFVGAASGILTAVKATWALVTASKALAIAALGGKLALIALVAYGVYKATQAIADYVLGSSDYEATLERSKQLNAELLEISEKKNQKQLDEIAGISNLEDRRKALNDIIEIEKKNMAGLNAQISGQKKAVEESDSAWKRWTGNKMLQEEKRELEETMAKLGEKKEHYKALQEQLQSLNQEIQDNQEAMERQKTEEELQAVEDFNKKIKDLQISLESQVATFGKAGYAADIYKLSMEGATEQQLEGARAAAAQLDQLEAEKEAREKLKEQMDEVHKQGVDWIAQLTEQDATMRMTADAAELYRINTSNLSEEHKQQARDLVESIKKQREHLKLIDKGKDLMEQYRSPVEKFKDTQAELNMLRKKGAIDDKTYQRAIKDAKDQLEEAEKQAKKDYNVHFSATGIDSIEAGSTEAMARLAEYRAYANEVSKEGVQAKDPAGIGSKVASKPPVISKPQVKMNPLKMSGVDIQIAIMERIAANTKKAADKDALVVREAKL
jgi:TP901 family phage tail tape measure protein